MKIPSRLKIKGKLWKVYVEPDAPKRKRRKLLQPTMRAAGYMGLCFPDTRDIFIGAHLDDEEKLDTFVHELLHACCPIQSKAFTFKQEEAFVSHAAPRLVSALKSMGWIK